VNRLKTSGWRSVTAVVLVAALSAGVSGCAGKSAATAPPAGAAAGPTSSAAPGAASSAAPGIVTASALSRPAYDGYLLADYPEKEVPLFDCVALGLSSIAYEKSWKYGPAEAGTGANTHLTLSYQSKASPADILASYGELMSDESHNSEATKVSGRIGDLRVWVSAYEGAFGWTGVGIDILRPNPRPGDLDKYFAAFPTNLVELPPGSDQTNRTFSVFRDAKPKGKRSVTWVWTSVWTFTDAFPDGDKALVFYRKYKASSGDFKALERGFTWSSQGDRMTVGAGSATTFLMVFRPIPK